MAPAMFSRMSGLPHVFAKRSTTLEFDRAATMSLAPCFGGDSAGNPLEDFRRTRDYSTLALGVD
jgi:hypothetical protein